MKGEETLGGCKTSEALLENYLSGELPRAEAEQLAAHAQSCAACREALEEARLSARLVRGAFEPAEEPGPAFTHLVMAKINAAETWMREQSNFWRPFERLAWRLAFTAALALMFLFAYGFEANNAGTGAAPMPTPTAFAQPSVTFTAPAAAPSSADDVLVAIVEKQNEQQ
jgi:anti-sigma factor RsiW